MRNRSRVYNKPTSSKSPKKFIIVAEGDREDKYFTKFKINESKLSIFLAKRVLGQSAPSHFLSRLNLAEESGEYDPSLNDEVWFVCDNDRNWRTHIHSLKVLCDANPNWNIAISNPCFEVWLHFHSGSISNITQTCADLKSSLPSTALGHFDADEYYLRIVEAAENARQADTSPHSYFPDVMQTKLYRLADSMLSVLGDDWI